MGPSDISFQKLLTMPENLYWAWEKYKIFKTQNHLWSDEGEVAQFEASLESEFAAISSQFNKLKYKMSPLRALPNPTLESSRGKSEPHISYWVSVRDQVAWLAFMNIAGPWIDSAMPVWSYGNRLYRTSWTERIEERSYIKTGWYRNTTGNIYRRPVQVWPLYRRHIQLTAKAMTGKLSPDELEPEELRILEAEASLADGYQLPYLQRDYWPANLNQYLFWSSLDLGEFTRNASTDHILSNMARFSDRFSDEIGLLAKQLLNFRVESEKISSAGKRLATIPDGLAVSGFLENIAMLDIDTAVSEVLSQEKKAYDHARPHVRYVAHFRYNKEHVFLGKTFEDIEKWTTAYTDIIRRLHPETPFAITNAKPRSFAKYLENTGSEKLRSRAIAATLLDPAFPLPAITRPVGIITGLALTEFDILHDHEKELYLSDLENLLHDKFPATPTGNDIRIDFAAGNLAKSAPKLIIGNHANLCHIEREFDEEQTRLNSLIKREASLIPGCDECNETRQHLARVRSRIKHLEEKKESVIQAGIKKSARIRIRIFYILLKALYDHPDQLRLWFRMLEFCRLSGHDDLKPVHEALDLLHQTDPKSAGYVRAIIIQILANQLMESIRVTANKKTSRQVRKAAISYMTAVTSSPIRFPEGTGDTFYEKSSVNAWECSLATVILALSEVSEHCRENRADLQAVIDRCTRISPLNWRENPQLWARETGMPLEIWIWWAEASTVNRLSTDPGPVWRRTVSALDPASPLTWAVWSKYPHKLLDVAGTGILSANTPAASAYFRRENSGRIHALLRNRNLSPRNLFHNTVNQVLKHPGDDAFTLDRWAEWTSRQYDKNTFDPRLSEWTALEITDQIIVTLLDEGRLTYPVHPANILVPEEWKHSHSRHLSWERWRETIKDRHKRITLRRKSLIIDTRYTHSIKNSSRKDKEWATVRGLCLLLFGLITRSFTLPAAWNTPGHERTGIPLIRTGMARHPFSSWTTAIMEGGIDPRQRETALLKQMYQTADDMDTALDPPLLTTLSQLRSYVRKAKNVLEKYQMTVHHNIPRQLIPVKLRHFTRPDWPEKSSPGNRYFPEKRSTYADVLTLGFIQTTTHAASAWKNYPEMTQAEADHAWKEIQEGFHLLSESRTKPHIIILPELAVPDCFRENLVTLCKKTGSVVIAGMDYNLNHKKKRVKNQATVIVPRRWPDIRQSRRYTMFNFGKTYLAPGERQGVAASGLTFESDQTVWLFNAGEFGRIGVCICYDFMDVERYMIYKGRIHHLIVLAYNRDIDSFYHLADSLSKTLFCNVIICNTGFFGGSVAVSPYYEPYNRTLYRQEGNNLFSTQVVKLPVSELNRAQKGEDVMYFDENGNRKRLFKRLPPGFQSVG